MADLQHTDKCASWDDPDYCDCGAVECDRLDKEVARLAAENTKLREALRDIRYNYDCDSDAYKYQGDIGCRCCLAEQALKEAGGWRTVIERQTRRAEDTTN
jgi:hypothetical protein